MKTCILAIQRYEHIEDIKEWVDYHLNINFDNIFLMDNNDEDKPLNLSIEKLKIIPYYGQRNDGNDWKWQREAYNFGLNYIRSLNIYDWIAVIDIDEFITFKSKYNNINNFIENECEKKGLDNIELKWELYDDNNLIFKNDNYYGHVLETFTSHINIDNIEHWNNLYNWYSMKAYTKFIGKIKPELYFSNSSHYPAKELYETGVYTINLCDENICILRHYKYKTLEDFIEYKCKQRNYVTSIHGSTWKYARTYFEDNCYNYQKVFMFTIFDFKYKLNMIKFDIEYLQELLNNLNNNNGKINVFHIYYNIHDNYEFLANDPESDYNEYHIYYSDIDINVCEFTQFMYNYRLYNICSHFFECLFLYYFGGSFMNNRNNIIKPFNIHFKSYIEYCRTYTYEQLEDLYNELDKQDFIDMFLYIE